MWTLQPPRSICAPHHAPCHACHVYPLWVHYKSQKIKDSLCFKQSHMYFERREGKPSLCSPAYLLFSMFYIPAQGPVFSPPDTSLQPGELSVAFLEDTSTSDTLSLLLTSPPSLEGAVWAQDPGGWSPSLSITVPGHQVPTISKAVLSSVCFQDSPFPFGFQYWFQWCEQAVLFVLCKVHWASCICTFMSLTTLGNFSAILSPLLLGLRLSLGHLHPAIQPIWWISSFRYCIFQFWNFHWVLLSIFDFSAANSFSSSIRSLGSLTLGCTVLTAAWTLSENPSVRSSWGWPLLSIYSLQNKPTVLVLCFLCGWGLWPEHDTVVLWDIWVWSHLPRQR